MIKRIAGVGQEFSIRRMRMKRGRDILDGLHTGKRLRPVMDKEVFSTMGEIIPFGTINDNVTTS
ncbi:hypothetical protein CAEBREN_12998 [Caenorhabditis brenneri]|uniref:Uncharacterized protein n=1 Tax=Caenorhabditis brenneri TaxID=135651 RepID=G0MJ48_CAEBE|nr:hypothetical protein CAEBREN_12998 [Caenorhabditis brenneri]